MCLSPEMVERDVMISASSVIHVYLNLRHVCVSDNQIVPVVFISHAQGQVLTSLTHSLTHSPASSLIFFLPVSQLLIFSITHSLPCFHSPTHLPIRSLPFLAHLSLTSSSSMHSTLPQAHSPSPKAHSPSPKHTHPPPTPSQNAQTSPNNFSTSYPPLRCPP